MSRSNNSGRKPQSRRRADGSKGQPRSGRTPIEKLIVPKGKCYFRSRAGKMIFTAGEADAALKQAQANRNRLGTAYSEKRAYACPEGGCGGYHLTSRETYTERGAV